MALSDFEKSTIYDYSLRLLQQDILTNATFASSQVGKDLRDLVLQKQPARTPKDPMQQALSGTLRADSRTLRAAAGNVTEAQHLYETAQSGSGAIKNNIERMQEIIQGVDDGTYTQAEVQNEYDDLIDSINATVDNTSFNGISLLNKNDWSSDNRISVSGNTGTFDVFAGGSTPMQQSLTDMYSMVVNDGSAIFASTDLDAANRSTALTTLSNTLSLVSSLNDSYSNKASSLEFSASSLQTQADVAHDAATNRAPDNVKPLEELLLDYISSQTGNILDTDG
jgi:flagellin